MKRNSRWRLTVTFAIWLPDLCAAASDVSQMGLDELLRVDVEGASRYSQPLAETPSTATVVTAEEIRRYGFRDLGEALQTARGVYVTHDRTYTYLGIRGFGRPADYNTRVLLLQDGARTNDPLYDQAMIGHESPIEMEWIKRLEFVPGPSSASYGSNALFGIANAVLWNGADLDGTRVAVDVGEGRLGRVGLLSGSRTEAGLDWVAGLSIYGRRGDNLYFREFDSPATSNGVAHHLDGERYIKGLLKGSWENWRGSLSFASRVKDVPTGYYGTLFDTPGNFTRDRHLNLDLTHAMALSNEWSQQIRLHAGQYRYDANYLYAAVVSRDEAEATWWSAEYQLAYTGWRDHRWLLGAEVKRSESLKQKYFDISPRQDYLDVNNKGRSSGIFVQDEWRFSPHWLANLGLRVDSQSTASTLASPRAALIYRPVDELTVKFLYGRAFRAANEYERSYGDGGSTQKPNPDLKPERITTQEVAAEITPMPSLRLGLGHYRYTIYDLIDQVLDPADGLLIFRNQDAITARGWEAEAEALLTGGWRVRGSLAWQTVKQPGGELSNSPNRLGKLLIDGPMPIAGWAMGLNLQAVDSRRTLQGLVPGYVTGNLVLRETLKTKRGAWSLGLYNISGKPYLDPGAREHTQNAIPSDGLQWRLRWEAGF